MKPVIKKHLNIPVDELGLPTRPTNALKKINVFYVGELVQLTDQDMRRIIGLGIPTYRKAQEILAGMGLSFGMIIEGFVRPKT